jgi:spermidine synthase
MGSAIRIRFYQRVLSYLQPLTLAQSSSPTGGYLELLLSRNQFLLLTDGALYSDGKRYVPAVTLADHLGQELRAVRTVLVLGTGVGSLVHVLRARGCFPRYTLVEKDPTVLGWAIDTLRDGKTPRADELEPVCQDAETFMAQSRRAYDLLFVDLFKGRRVPAFVTAPLFLRQCRDSLARGGRVALNYLADDQRQWNQVHSLFLRTFPGAHLASIRDNRILVSAPSTNSPLAQRAG